MAKNSGNQDPVTNWYANPVQTSHIILMSLIAIIFLAASAIVVLSYGLLGIPLFLIFLCTAGAATVHIIRLETKIKPRFVAVSEDGILFRYKDGSEKLHCWENIQELTITPQDIGQKKLGMIKLFDSRYKIPIPYDVFEEAIVVRKKTELSRTP